MVAAVAEPTVRYRLYPIQDEFVADESRYVAFIGGRNSGKTYSGSVKAMIRATQGGLGCIAAPSFPMLEHGAKRQFIDRLNEIGVRYDLNRSGVTIPDWQAEVVFVTLESESRVRGPNYDWAWPDEVEYVTDRKIWQALKGAVRAGDNPQIWVTSTPKGKRIVYDEWVENPTDHHALYKATTFDNVFIDADDYVTGLGYEGVFYDQEVGAEFVSFDGLVYATFNRDRNVKPLTPDDLAGWSRVLWIDVGTRNPTVVLTAYIAGDRIHIGHEVYRRGMSSDDMVDTVAMRYQETGATHAVIDPSAAALILSLQARGVVVRKGVNDVQNGILAVTSRLADLTIDPSCVETINEFESYRYPDGARANSDTPVKENDHCLIAGTMVKTETGDKPIETIQVGDLVWTRQGLRSVLAAGLTNPSVDVYTLSTSDGTTITSSSQHPIWTDNQGWVLMDALRYGDILSAWKSGAKPSRSTASTFGGIRTLLGGLIGSTTRRTVDTAKQAWAVYMKKSGRLLTVPFQTDTRFTTGTLIQATTTYPTLSASPSVSTEPSTHNVHPNGQGAPNTSRTSIRSVHSRLLGIVPKRGELGMLNTVDGSWPNGSQLPEHATSAASHSTLSITGNLTGSAPTSASQHGGVHLVSTTSSGSARIAERPSRSIATARPEHVAVRVLDVCRHPQKQAVYNLTVDSPHEFYANGILVHNSMDSIRYGVMDLMNGIGPDERLMV